VKEFVNAGVHRNERDLVSVRLIEGDEAHVIAFIASGCTRQRPSIVPVQRGISGDDEVHGITAESLEKGSSIRVSKDLPERFVRVQRNAGPREIADGLRPDSVRERADLPGFEPGVTVDHEGYPHE
jgi:hypothetical protein